MKLTNNKNCIIIDLEDNETLSDIQVRSRKYGEDTEQVWIKICKI